jgi:broad specificity phosphatase PhoE
MYFIRHGQSEFNAAMHRTGKDPGIIDAPLTERGRAEIMAATTRLGQLGITRLISSPYSRALQTASIIAAELGLTITADPLAGERAIYSCDIGTPLHELRLRWPFVDFSLMDQDQWWPEMPEGQADLERRKEAFLARMADLPDLATTLVASHWYFIFAATGADLHNGDIAQLGDTLGAALSF